MLKIVKNNCYARVYDTRKKRCITIKDVDGFADAYSDRILDYTGDDIIAKLDGTQDLRILKFNGKPKLIALILFKETVRDFKHKSINKLLEYPSTAVYLFNTNGESIVDFTGYKSKGECIYDGECKSVRFALSLGLRGFTLGQEIVYENLNGEQTSKVNYLQYLYNEPRKVVETTSDPNIKKRPKQLKKVMEKIDLRRRRKYGSLKIENNENIQNTNVNICK